jgi:hypothetical protein
MCSDQEICDFIESRPGFGTVFTIIDADGRDAIANPEFAKEVPVEDMERTIRVLRAKGLNVNPALLKGPDQDESEGEAPVPSKPPTKTLIRRARVALLKQIVKDQGWTDIDLEGSADYIRDAAIKKIEAANQE